MLWCAERTSSISRVCWEFRGDVRNGWQHQQAHKCRAMLPLLTWQKSKTEPSNQIKSNQSALLRLCWNCASSISLPSLPSSAPSSPSPSPSPSLPCGFGPPNLNMRVRDGFEKSGGDNNADNVHVRTVVDALDELLQIDWIQLELAR